MNRIGFLADLSGNVYDYKITKNDSLDRLLEILDKKCKESTMCFDDISKLNSEEEIKNNIINCNMIKRDTEAIIECISSYCVLNKIDLCNYIMQYYSERKYLTAIFTRNIKTQENQK